MTIASALPTSRNVAVRSPSAAYVAVSADSDFPSDELFFFPEAQDVNIAAAAAESAMSLLYMSTIPFKFVFYAIIASISLKA